MFEDINSQVKHYDIYNQKLFDINLHDNIYFNKALFKSKLEHLDDVPEAELYKMVQESYALILDEVANRTDTSYIKSFSNEKFLTILTNVLTQEYFIDHDSIIYCNMLAYDYMTYEDSNEHITQLFLKLTNYLNRNLIFGIMELGLNKDIASYLALAYCSTSDDMVRIKRINFILIQQNPKIMTVEKLVKIYSKLFSTASSLFIYTITDAFDIDENDENYEDKYTMYTYEAYAVITILNSMKPVEIHMILSMFLEYCAHYNLSVNDIRCSIRALPITKNNFRVLQAVEDIETIEHKFVL